MSTRIIKVHRVISILLLIAVMGTIFYLSSQDSTDSAQVSGSLVYWLHEILKIDLPDGMVRTIAHCCEFAALGFLMLNCARSFNAQFSPIKSVTLSFGYAVTDEIHQLFVPGRAFQLTDLCVDLAGIIFGTILFCLIAKQINKKQTA